MRSWISYLFLLFLVAGIKADDLPVVSNVVLVAAINNNGIWNLNTGSGITSCPGSDDCGAEVCSVYMKTNAVFFQPLSQIYVTMENYTPSAFWDEHSFSIQGLTSNDAINYVPIPGMTTTCTGIDLNSGSCFEFFEKNFAYDGYCQGFVIHGASPEITSC